MWIWLTLDRDSLPAVYRQCAVCYTDFWEAYKKVLPSKRHKVVGKETGFNPIERFNNTLRQRVSRLVRKTLSFSKKLENHMGLSYISLTITITHYLFNTTNFYELSLNATSCKYRIP